MYLYIHDKGKQIVYRMPLLPDVEEIIYRGKRTGWRVRQKHMGSAEAYGVKPTLLTK